MDADTDGSWRSLNRDWWGNGVGAGIFYRLGVDGGRVWISAKGTRAADVGEREAGSFFEGLWKWDVVELFLGAEGCESYLEIHLAPDGCWWAGEFAGDDRERVAEWRVKGISVERENREEGGWEVSLGVPVEFLGERIGGDVRTWRGNVSGMVKDGEGRRRYLTANRPDGDAEIPDFHRRQLRQKLKFGGVG